MANERKPINEGYRPEKVEKGYQPTQSPISTPEKVQGGYQPTTGQGGNPGNPPNKK